MRSVKVALEHPSGVRHHLLRHLPERGADETLPASRELTRTEALLRRFDDQVLRSEVNNFEK